jgi:hypothetical protein
MLRSRLVFIRTRQCIDLDLDQGPAPAPTQYMIINFFSSSALQNSNWCILYLNYKNYKRFDHSILLHLLV